jgi:hypothetical protein
MYATINLLNEDELNWYLNDNLIKEVLENTE